MKILWTPTARKTFFSIIDYLAENWSEKEVQSFTSKVEKVLIRIQKNPELFIGRTKDPSIRRGFVVKQVSLIYRVVAEKSEIHLLTFWDNRQNPEKLLY